MTHTHFEGRLAADVHEQDVVPLHHMLEHLLAGKASNGRPAESRSRPSRLKQSDKVHQLMRPNTRAGEKKNVAAIGISALRSKYFNQSTFEK